MMPFLVLSWMDYELQQRTNLYSIAEDFLLYISLITSSSMVTTIWLRISNLIKKSLRRSLKDAILAQFDWFTDRNSRPSQRWPKQL